MRLIFSASLLALMTACATGLSEDQCLTGDARNYGFEDGRDGKALVSIEDRVQQCARYDVGFDREGYRQGWDDGNAIFCTPRGALETALNGKGDIRNCLGATFLTTEAFRVGREYEDAEDDYDSARDRYESLISTINQRRSDISRAYKQMRTEKNPEGIRKLENRIAKFRRELREAEDNLSYARSQLRFSERDLDDARYELDRFRSELRRLESQQ